MTNERVVTIVVPSYNMEGYIRKNLDSLMAARNIGRAEVIVVNDGSTDRTSAIAHEYQERMPGVVRVINKPNGHYGSCINAALREARGRYFRILDADDWMDSAALEEFIDKLGDAPADLVVTLRVEVETGSDGRQKQTCQPLKDMEYGHTYDATQFEFKAHSEHVEFNMHSMTYRTDVLRAIGLSLPCGICYTDLLYCFMPLDRIATLVAYDLRLYHYLTTRPDSSTSRRSMRRNMTHMAQVLALMLAHMERNPAPTAAIRANQLRFVTEATGMLLSCLREQWHVGRKEYATLADIQAGWKRQGVTERLFHKYYFRPWMATGSRLALNLSLVLWHILHPLK